MPPAQTHAVAKTEGRAGRTPSSPRHYFLDVLLASENSSVRVQTIDDRI